MNNELENYVVYFHNSVIADLKTQIPTAKSEKEKKAIENKITERKNFLDVEFPEWKKLHDGNKIKLPAFTLKINKKQEKTLVVELLKEIRKAVNVEDLAKFTSNDFAKICAIEYGSTNTSVNGFEQALRGFAFGAGFEWLPASRASANQSAKATINAQQEKISRLENALREKGFSAEQIAELLK
jgi:hypothetical protein